MDHLFIVMWKQPNGKWAAEAKGVFEEKRLAASMIEVCKAQGQAWEYGILEGSMLTPEPAEQF